MRLGIQTWLMTGLLVAASVGTAWSAERHHSSSGNSNRGGNYGSLGGGQHVVQSGGGNVLHKTGGNLHAGSLHGNVAGNLPVSKVSHFKGPANSNPHFPQIAPLQSGQPINLGIGSGGAIGTGIGTGIVKGIGSGLGGGAVSKIPLKTIFPAVPTLPWKPGVIVKPWVLGGGCIHYPHCFPCPTIWWYPRPFFCGTINHCYYPAVYPVNEVIIVEKTVLVDGKIDLALVDVKLVDAGDLASKLGPRYRVTVRNHGSLDAGEFHVLCMAGVDKTPQEGSPAAMVKIAGLAAGVTKQFELRLPVESLTMLKNAEGNAAPFATLFAAVDAYEQVTDQDRTNNGVVLDRTEIQAAGF